MPSCIVYMYILYKYCTYQVCFVFTCKLPFTYADNACHLECHAHDTTLSSDFSERKYHKIVHNRIMLQTCMQAISSFPGPAYLMYLCTKKAHAELTQQHKP